MFKKFRNWINSVNQDQELAYLEASVSLQDLERRQRMVQRGAAPYQELHRSLKGNY